MIKAAGTDRTTGERLIILGLSRENVNRLQEDKPITFSMKPFGIEGSVVIFFGETEQAMVEALQRNGITMPAAKAWEDHDTHPSDPPSADSSND
jgi:hypothetical protein